MAKMISAPTKYNRLNEKIIFLSGSTENSDKDSWQDKLLKELEDLNVTMLNPYRADYNSLSDSELTKQIEWELDGLERADIVAIYFDSSTKAAITLLELGLSAKNKTVVIFCEGKFWKHKEVTVVAKKYKLSVFDNYDNFVKKIKHEIGLERFVRLKELERK